MNSNTSIQRLATSSMSQFGEGRRLDYASRASKCATWRVSGADVCVLLLLTWLSFRPLLPPIPAYSHISTVFLFCGAIAAAWRHGLPEGRLFRWVLTSTLVLSIEALCFHGAKESLYPLLHIGGACAYIVMFRSAKVDPRIILLALFLLVIPEFLFSTFIVGDIHASARALVGLPLGNVPTIIPQEATRWRINIGPYGTTVHFTGELGLLVVLTCTAMLQRTRRVLYLLGIAVGLYFIAFSGARTAYLSLFICGCLWLINRSRIRPFGSALAVSALLVGLYSVDAAEAYVPHVGGVVGELLRLDDRQDSKGLDITNARAWLWARHASALSSAPFAGVGFEPIAFSVGERVDGEYVRATTESFYTAMLAVYGVPGILFVLFHCTLFLVALRTRERYLISLTAIVLISTAANSSYGVIYGTFTPFVYATLAAAFGKRPRAIKLTVPPVSRACSSR